MEIQKTAKTVNLAIDEALRELNTTIDNIEYQVLQEPSKGFFGIGSKLAKISVSIKGEEIETKNISSEQESKTKIETKSNQQASNKRETSINQDIKVPRMVTEEETAKYIERKDINKNAPDVAEKFLKEVFKAMDLDISIKASLDDREDLIVKLGGENVGIAIGKRGQTLDSLQYLVNLVVNKGEFAYMNVIVDTEDYRERRRQTLENLAVNLAKKAKKTRKSVNIEPMSATERRIIHSKLQDDTSIKTYSEGNEPFRYVVIAPKK